MEPILEAIFAIDSFWSIVARGVLWFFVAVIIILSTDKPNPEQSLKDLKANLGFFILFLLLSGGLIYLLFGFSTGPVG